MAENHASKRLPIARQPHKYRIGDGLATHSFCRAQYIHVSQTLLVWYGIYRTVTVLVVAEFAWAMKTILEYFETDFVARSTFLWTQQIGLYCEAPSFRETILTSCIVDLNANAMFGAYFVPSSAHTFSICVSLVHHPEWVINIYERGEEPYGGQHGRITAGGDIKAVVQREEEGGVILHGKMQSWEDREVKPADAPFSGRIFLYCEDQLSGDEINFCVNEGRARGLDIHYRGPQYAVLGSEQERPLAFISHDSRDKDKIARPLAEELGKVGFSVWYDEFSLRVGDSLRESIERGLREARTCILILTPHFLTNPGWTKTEFNAVFTRELVEKKKVILPVWHEVTVQQVYEYSPSLADRFALKWPAENEVAAKQAAAELQPVLLLAEDEDRLDFLRSTQPD